MKYYGESKEMKKEKGKSNFANMPQEVMMKEYPKPRDGMPDKMDDTIMGIDKCLQMSEKKLKKQMKDKY